MILEGEHQVCNTFKYPQGELEWNSGAALKSVWLHRGVKLIYFPIFNIDKREETILTTNRALLSQLMRRCRSMEDASVPSISTWNLEAQTEMD
jgi:hypothetical protein